MVVGKLKIWAKGNYQPVNRLVMGNRLETTIEFILGSLCPANAFEHIFCVHTSNIGNFFLLESNSVGSAQMVIGFSQRASIGSTMHSTFCKYLHL